MRLGLRLLPSFVALSMGLTVVTSPSLAVSKPCPENSSFVVYKGLVFDSQPKWAIRECLPTYATGAVAMLRILERRGYKIPPLGDEAYRVTHDEAARLTMDALKAKQWVFLSEEDIVTRDGLVLVRYYQHSVHGRLAFGIMPAADGNVYHIYLRYK